MPMACVGMSLFHLGLLPNKECNYPEPSEERAPFFAIYVMDGGPAIV